MKIAFRFLLLLIIFVFIGCATQEEVKKYKMSGSIQGPSKSALKNVYAGLFSAGSTDFTVTPKYSVSVKLDSIAQCTYSVNEIEKGSYAAGIFIDMNNNGILDTGDYCTYMTSGSIKGNTSPGDITFEKDYQLHLLVLLIKYIIHQLQHPLFVNEAGC